MINGIARLVQLFSQFPQRLGKRRLLLIALERLQRTDGAWREQIHVVAHELQCARCVIIAIGSSEESDPADALRRLLLFGLRRGGVRWRA